MLQIRTAGPHHHQHVREAGAPLGEGRAAGILLHGMCYDFIFVMGRMYVDGRATQDIRGAAQGLHALVTLGVGMFIGSSLAGVVGEKYASEASGAKLHDWSSIWLVPAGLSPILIVLFVVLFRDGRATPAAADDDSKAVHPNDPDF